jgi:formylglycine-generating enzyme required for sulfatase activity
MHTPSRISCPGSKFRFGRVVGLLAGFLALLPRPAEAAAAVTLVLESAPDAGGPWAARSSVQVATGQAGEVFRLRVEAATGWQPAGNYVEIPAGRFVMGTSTNEAKRSLNEGPQTTVVFSRPIWMGRYEVTQAEFTAVMGVNPSVVQGEDLPVDQVSWPEAMEYCEKLTVRERAAGRLPEDRVYRLPTEAEWEYACRAGTTTATSFGNTLSSTQANFDGGVPYGDGAEVGPRVGGTVKVGSYPPNAWGLHDMHGNVWEWCGDWYGSRLLGGKFADPVAPSSASTRTLRGGGWETTGQFCRSATRYTIGPLVLRTVSSGFRTVVGWVEP